MIPLLRSSHQALLSDEQAPKEATSECWLCGEHVPSLELARHLERDAEELRHYTLRMIRLSHPGWITEDGSYDKCIEYYEQL